MSYEAPALTNFTVFQVYSQSEKPMLCEIHLIQSPDWCPKRVRWLFLPGNAYLCGEHKKAVERRVKEEGFSESELAALRKK